MPSSSTFDPEIIPPTMISGKISSFNLRRKWPLLLVMGLFLGFYLLFNLSSPSAEVHNTITPGGHPASGTVGFDVSDLLRSIAETITSNIKWAIGQVIQLVSRIAARLVSL